LQIDAEQAADMSHGLDVKGLQELTGSLLRQMGFYIHLKSFEKSLFLSKISKVLCFDSRQATVPTSYHLIFSSLKPRWDFSGALWTTVEL